MDADEQALLQAYADGVNAYLADHKGAAFSLEYAILKLLTPGYSPEPWQPAKYPHLGESHGMGPSPARVSQRSSMRSC